ncbi:Rv3235 family protein [Streptomyces sp. NPDC046862]|uniref:Rv3235 family protein n=1 Tax=Streptomyces sp. NPDC046862 TaxID=3154603 RepID=UPI00345569A8
MNKVMTRTRRHPATRTRPPVRHDTRHDTRHPGGNPTRTAPPRTAPGHSRPSTTPGSTTPGSAASGTMAVGTAATGTAAAGTAATGTTAADTAVLGGPVRPPAPCAAPLMPALPQPRPTDHFADLLLAVLSGQRPVHSMLRHTVGRAYDELAWLAERGPLRTTRGTRPVVRDIGYYEPRPGAIEAFARIGAGDQLRAMAFRLEHGPDHRWRCTAVELGGPRMPGTDED